MEEKIENILDNNLMHDGQLDKSKAIKELLILFGVSNCTSCGIEINYKVICDVCNCKGTEAYEV